MNTWQVVISSKVIDNIVIIRRPANFTYPQELYKLSLDEEGRTWCKSSVAVWKNYNGN